jgi:hypothetical protein
MPCPCRAANGLECVFPIWFTQCGRVWFTLAMPRPCHALTMPFLSRSRHSKAVDRRPVGYLPALGFFRLPHGVPRRLLSEAYQSSSQQSIPTTVKSGRGVCELTYGMAGELHGHGMLCVNPPLHAELKSHLPSSGIIRGSPYFPR